MPTYWPQQLAAKGLAGDKLTQAMYWHALPEDWQHLPFDDFLAARRKRMALVVKDAMTRLTDIIDKPDNGPDSRRQPEKITNRKIMHEDGTKTDE